jgi:hypothetical protein
MLWVDVQTIPCGFRASTTVHSRIILCPAATKDSTWPSKSWPPTSVVITAWRRIHIPIKSIWRLLITFYMSGVEVHIIPCEFKASTISWQYHLVFNRNQRFQWSSHIWADKSWGNGMKTDPYPHPQHIKFISQLFYFEWMCGNHSMWV